MSDEHDTSTTPEHTGSPAPVQRITLALLSVAAGGIHFAAIADHLQIDLVHGLFFATVAWAQVLWGVGILLVQGSWFRRLVWAGVAGNLAIVGTWALSRTVGVPIGPGAWTPESVGTTDVVATLCEVAIVTGCVLALVGRSEPAPVRAEGAVSAIAVGLGLAVVSTLAIALAPEHSHAEGAGHTEAAGEAHSHGGEGAEASGGAGEGEEGHAHGGATAPGSLDIAQIERVTKAMARYTDVEVAFSEGWQTEHEDWPEVGSHFYKEGDWSGPFPAEPGIDLANPEFLMYSKIRTGDEWELIAVAYVADKALYPEPPERLRGAHWHEHVWTCTQDGEELEEDEWGPISEEECAAMGGVWDPGGVWMTHVWFIENPAGVFAEDNPALV